MKIFFYGFTFCEARQVDSILQAESCTTIDKGAAIPSQLKEDLERNAGIDIILMNPGLPGESSLTLISEISEIANGRPVVLITHNTADWSTFAKVKQLPHPVVGYADNTFRAVFEKVTEKAASHT